MSRFKRSTKQDQARVRGALKGFPGSPIKVRTLAMALGMEPRIIRDAVHNLRIAGEPIASGNEGYYWARSRWELVKTQRRFTSQVGEMLRAYTGITEAYNRLPH